MHPTPEQVRDAAYDRWQRRGGAHGQDFDDWLRAQQDLLYALNYDIVARVGSGPTLVVAGNGASRAGRPSGRVCRFCELSEPRVRFNDLGGTALEPSPTIGPGGNLTVGDECDECRQLFHEALEADLARFLRPICSGSGSGSGGAPVAIDAASFVPIAAFKGMTRMALACLPRAELPAFEDTIEWINNPEHDFDSRAFGPLNCEVHRFAAPFPDTRAVLSLRRDDDAPMPYALFHLGQGHALFQIAVPLSGRDDELDGLDVIVPHAAPLLVTGRDDDPISSTIISLASTRATPLPANPTST